MSHAQTANPAAPPTATSPSAPKVSSRGRKVTVGVLALVLAAPVLWWNAHRGFESTDDAQVDADVVTVPSRASGPVIAVHFEDNQRVLQGALLFELDDAVQKARVARAEAALHVARASLDAARATVELVEKNASAGQTIAKASLTGAAASVAATSDQSAELQATLHVQSVLRDKARIDLDRAKELAKTGALSTSELESAQAAYDGAQASVDQAKARLVTLQSTTSQAKAHATEARAKLGQIVETFSPQVAEARAKAAAAEGQLASAEAELELAKLDLSFTKVYAPQTGIISKRSVSVGEMVNAGQGVAVVIPSAQDGALWITGNFKETQLRDMRVGQPATIGVDAYGRELHGHVASFSGATGARFALLPPDNATGNFTKVVQRVPVRIELDEPPPELLLPGLSVELTIDTRQ